MRSATNVLPVVLAVALCVVFDVVVCVTSAQVETFKAEVRNPKLVQTGSV